MGLMRSLYAGVSGLRNHQVMMDVLGNNISNVNTIGFKTGRASFSETFAQTLRGTTQPQNNLGGTNPMQVGLGISLGALDTMFGQGNIETTGQTTDLAIQGDGFFIVSDGSNRYYTRAGNFQFDANGSLVMPGSGARVQGYLANSEGKIEAGSPLTDIVLPFGKKISAKATSKVKLAGNLDASAKPQGNILKTQAVYAVDDGASDLEGLLATGNANAKITSLSSGTTEVKVTVDGVEKSYKYVTTDTAVGNTSFHTINDLIDELNNDFGGATFTAAFNSSAGTIDFSGTATVAVESNHPNLGKALQSLNGDLSVAATSSDSFSHAARSTDLLTNLRDQNGQSLGLAVGDEININANVGGTAITPYAYSITATSTYQDYATQISTALGLTNSKAVEINADDGALKINADGGKIYEITGLDIRADDTAGAGGTDRTVFNAIFDSTPSHYTELQNAEDVKQSASITVYDSQGNAFDLTLIFTKDVTTPNKWKWEIEVPEPASVTSGKTGTVQFNTDGSMQAFEFDDGSSTLQLNPGTGSTDLVSIEFNPGNSGEFNGITQLAGSSTSVLITDQDGYGMGSLERIVIDEVGNISGAFTNGIVQVLGQISLASFNNPGGLLRTQNNLFAISGNSGDPIISTAGEGISASIISGALEQSNVDLAEEFTKMIVAQRGFQANARIITTSDDLLQEVTNLKR